MFSNEFVGIIVLIATFTVGLLVGWKFWGQAAKKAVDDKRDVEQDVLNERRKGTALQQKWDDARSEIEAHKKRVAELEATVSVAPVPVEDGAGGKAALEAAEKARNEADVRAQLAEARALEAEKRLSENETRGRVADTLPRRVEVRAEARSEIEEAKAKREAEAAKAKADAAAKAEEAAKAQAEAKAKAHAEAQAEAEAKAKAQAEAQAEAKAKADAEAKAQAEAKADAEAKAQAEAKADAEAKAQAEAKADAEAQAQAEAEAKAQAEAEAKAQAEAEAKAKADAEAKAQAEAEAKAKADAEAKAQAEAEAKAKAEAEAAAAKVSVKPDGVSDAYWAMFGDKVPVAEAGAKDEFVGQIKGIGPITGKRLNDLGIYTYAQLAAFDSEIVARVAAAVGAIPAKAEKDDWPGQAKKKLAEGPKT